MDKNKSYQERYLRNGLGSFDKMEMIEFLLSLKVDNNNHYELAKELSNKYRSLNDIVDESYHELRKISGFKDEHLIGLKLPFHFSNIYLFEKSKLRPITSSPEATYNYLKHSMRGSKIEQFNVLYLNSCNEILSHDIRLGTINQVAVYPRDIIKSAIEYNAVSLIFAHNHPSGNTQPSNEDIAITKRLKDAANLLEIKVLDHIIVAENKYFSFSEANLI